MFKMIVIFFVRQLRLIISIGGNNLALFHGLPKRQNKVLTKFSHCMAYNRCKLLYHCLTSGPCG